ncbi:hypothetical protein BRD10_00035 [Halobacteriales archaeon SW_12_71_31]|nr:MAG: hypothetical protein BRD10_00035 [Halobacteriales archaeon SW_12_71_31]
MSGDDPADGPPAAAPETGRAAADGPDGEEGGRQHTGASGEDGHGSDHHGSDEESDGDGSSGKSEDHGSDRESGGDGSDQGSDETGEDGTETASRRGVETAGRQLHPLSVPYRAVTRALRPSTILVVVTAVGPGSLDPQSLTFTGLLLAGLAATFAYQYGYYRRFRFALTGDTLDVASGVLSRRSREIPLRRVQNVDVGQNPLQRAMGIAAVRIETAGGGDTEAVLEYLGRETAERLRDDLRRAARRARAVDGEVETEAGTADGAEPGVDETVGGESESESESEREEVFTLSRRSLAVVSLFSFDAGAGVVSSVVGALLSGGDPSNLVGVGRVLADLPLGPVETAVIGVAAVGVLAWLLSVVLTVARYYGFRLVRVDEGLEYERGLVQQHSGTIPVEKVQTVSLRSNLVHRRLGYLAVAVETAGYSPGSERSARQLAVPLAPRSEALRVARSVEPFAVDDDDDAEATFGLERPPRRARRRYVVRFALAVLALTGLAAVALGLLAARGVGPGLAVDRRLLAAPLAALLLTPVAAHRRWRSRGHAAGPEHFLARTGYWRRVTRVVPYYRVQTVIESRTPFQRRRRLASVTADTASSASLLGGEAVALDVDADRAVALRERLRTELDRVIGARASDRERPEEARSADGDDPADGQTSG